ncbi:MAG: signal peptidase I [Candidatus Acidiferrales bacterium]
MAKQEAASEGKPQETKPVPLKKKVINEAISWMWVILAFLFIHGTIVQARVIPSPSMEQTLLIGDHLLVSRFGYDAQVPFTSLHVTLWRDPERQQVVVFRAPLPGSPDFIKRVIGIPGDRLDIRDRGVWINGRPLDEPYLIGTRNGADDSKYNSVVVPPGHYFVMGDNRDNSYDSRYWGFLPRENILGTPLIIYMSVDAPEDAWQPGHLKERFLAYAGAIIRPTQVRWKRLFVTF